MQNTKIKETAKKIKHYTKLIISENKKQSKKRKNSKKLEKNIDYNYISGLIYAKNNKKEYKEWEGITSVPPGSLLEDILTEFSKVRVDGYPATSIPLDIPFLLFFHIVSAYLISNDVIITVNNQKIYCDFWTVLLSGSGSGKTWTLNRFKESFLSNLDSIVFEMNMTGGASFMLELEKHHKGLWVRDEVQQLFNKTENKNSSSSDIYDYMLRLYDNATLERVTKDDTIVIENPVLSFFGMNTPEAFIKNITEDRMTDGQAQRYAYQLTTEKSQEDIRFWQKVPDWHVDTSNWKEKWDLMFKNLQTSYIVSESGLKEYRRIYLSYAKNTQVNESFFRRILWRIHKYAMVYHIINFQAEKPELTSLDYLWAERLIEKQLTDTYTIIDGCSGGMLSKKLKRAEEVIQKFENENKTITARALVQYIKDIKTIQEAESILKILHQPKKNVVNSISSKD